MWRLADGRVTSGPGAPKAERSMSPTHPGGVPENLPIDIHEHNSTFSKELSKVVPPRVGGVLSKNRGFPHIKKSENFLCCFSSVGRAADL